MVFQRGDIYTSSGSTMLHNAWTPYVSKFDTSSFYNWEQDNLPLYDLEERTYELWEQAGFPTSAVPGLALTVSGTAPAATLAANSNIFTTVQSCIAAIPKVIRFPVLIEVGNLGDLGALELHNFKIEESGSIEIINRAYSTVYNASADCTVIETPAGVGTNGFTPLVRSFDSADVSATLFSGIGDNACTSALAINQRVLAAADTGPGGTVNSVNSFIYPKLTLREAPLSVSLGYNGFMTGTANRFEVRPYENQLDSTLDGTLPTTDVSATAAATNATIKRTPVSVDAAQDLGGSVYLNTLTKLSIKNCDGPIFVRNFCVNGESAANTGRDVGIEVTNSDVVLENCAAARCREAGFRFNNSKVVLSRSAYSYRNYTLTTATTRAAQTGIGFHAINSDVSISALLEATTEIGGVAGDFQASGNDVIVAASRNYTGFKLDNSKLHGGFQRLFSTDEDSGGITTAEVNTGYGILANNSDIDLKGLVDVYGNDKGIQLDNSKFTYQNLCVEDHTGTGLRARNSIALFDSVTNPGVAGQSARYQVDFVRNSQHIDLQKQTAFTFSRKNNSPQIFGSMSFSGAQGVLKWDDATRAPLPAISVDDNSVLDLIKPRIITRTQTDSISNMPIYGQAIKANNNSTISLYGTGNGCSFVWGTKGYSYQQKAAGLYADNQSTINLHGPTVVAQFGVDALAENQSTINIQPPRVRDSFAPEASGFDLSSGSNHTSVELHSTRACLVANKNSTINLEDLGAYNNFWNETTNGLGELDAGLDYPIGSYNISSLIVSGSLQFFPNPQDSNVVSQYYLDDLENAAGRNITPGTIPVFTSKRKMNTYLAADNPLTSGGADYAVRAKLTWGGVCVRATEDSVVNVKNVQFGVGPRNNPLDGHYYNSSATECDMLGIWNIADTSRLNASYCSVSGMYPLDALYHGPSAIYMSSVNGTLAGLGNEVPAFGAPEGTPDTGSLSVLDAFGAGSSVWVIPSGVDFNSPFDRFTPVTASGNFAGNVYGDQMASAIAGAGMNVSGFNTQHWGAAHNVSNNKGLFRIYWSVNSAAKYLQNDLSGYYLGAHNDYEGDFSGVVGPAYQLFSQGYNCSAPLSAIIPTGATSISGTYPCLVKMSADSDGDGIADRLWTSGFYYCEEFVDDNPTQCMLDESAGSTFANSKNASVGFSGRPRKVTLYRSRADTNRGSEAYPGDTSGALGFKSSNIFDLSRDN